MWYDVLGFEPYLQVTKSGKVRRKACARSWTRESGVIHEMPISARVLNVWVDRQGYATIAVRAGTKNRKKFRELLARGKHNNVEIGKIYNVSDSLISQIRNGRHRKT